GELGGPLAYRDDLVRGRVASCNQSQGSRVGESESVLQAPNQDQCVNSRGPFAVIAQKQVGFLGFGDAHGPAGGGLIVILQNITGMIIRRVDLEKEGIV